MMVTISQNKKAQVFTWDLIVSITIFLLVLAVAIYLWNTILWNITYSEEVYELQWLSTTLSEQLVRTSGIPKNWSLNSSEVIVIGLADVDRFGYSQDRVLDADKLLYFINFTVQNYSITRYKFLGTGKYDFYIELSCLNQTENCWNGISLDTLENATINCFNNANFSVINKTLTFQGEPRCIFGNYTTPSSSILITQNTKTATFKSNLNATIKITLALWTGISAPIPLIPVMTTTTTLPTGALTCNIYTKGSCPGGFDELTFIFSLYNYTNSHAGILESYGYYDVCCKVKNGVLTSYNTTSGCSLGHGCVVSLFNKENSHAEDCSTGLYENDICMNASLGNISCSLLGPGIPCNDYAVASLYAQTNAHVGGVGDYSYTICCGVTVATATTTTTTPGTTTTTTAPATTTTTTTTTLPTLSCSIRNPSCNIGETCVFTLYDPINGGHAANCTGGTGIYDNKVCCVVDGCAPDCQEVKGTTCPLGYEPVIALYQGTNAHAQDPDIYSTYDNLICCDTSACGVTLSCQVTTSCTNTTLASMYQLDNSHVGGETTYNNKICCVVT